MKPLRLVAILTALLGAATLTASAQQATAVLQSYDVELLVFRTLTPNTSPEEWGFEAAAAGQRLAIPEDEPTPFAASEPAPPTIATFPPLAPAKFKLTAIAETLRRSRNYQPLAHFGWTQPGYPRNDAKYLPINSMVPAGSRIAGSDCAVARTLSAPDAGPGVRRAGRGRRADAALRAAPEPSHAQQRAALHGFAEVRRHRDRDAERTVRLKLLRRELEWRGRRMRWSGLTTASLWVRL